MEEQCQRYNYRVAKEINIPSLHHLTSTPPAAQKILHLVRDPRGVFSSRIKIKDQKQFVNVRQSHIAAEKNLIGQCQQTHNDLKFIMSNNHSLEYHLVRYENIALDAEYYTRRIYKAVGFPTSDDVIKWVVNATNSAETNIWGTTRKSKTVPFAWASYLPLDVIHRIERGCADVMLLLGYLPVSNILLHKKSRTLKYSEVLTGIDKSLDDVTIK